MKLKPDTPIHYLKPGGFFFLKKPGVIRTVLGSCVTVTMFARNTNLGAACHPVLPECRNDKKVCYFAGCTDKFRYVECVIPEMMRLFRKEGVTPDELEVKLFGGSEMIINSNPAKQVIRVGLMNTEMALNILHSFDIQPDKRDTGGQFGRRLFFDTSNGDVWIKKITTSSASLFEKKDFQKQNLMQRKG